MTKVKKDAYSNKAAVEIGMSGADALTFEEVRFNVGLFQGVGLVIHEITFEAAYASLRELVANTDLLEVALTVSNAITTLNPIQDQVIARYRVVGMGAGIEPIHQPFKMEFSHLPGGGLIVAANPLFVGMDTMGFAAAGGAVVVIRYSFKELTDRDYMEILQTTRAANI